MDDMTHQDDLPERGWRSISPNLDEEPAADLLSRRRAGLWALVLAARRIPCRIESTGDGWRLLVPAACRQAALKELRLYEEENRHWPPPLPPQHPPAQNSLATLSVLLLLATFHNLTLLDLRLPGHDPIDWVALGNAHAGKILAGEGWRLLTALTLHSGWLHLLGNLAIGGVFIVRLCRDLGSGLAWSLILASGALGNLLNAFVQSPAHRSVGASTAVFGAVGLLAALGQVRYRHNLRKRWPLPLAAALALLALLGSAGENTDLGAHLFGFASGFSLGWSAGHLLRKFGRPGQRLNILLALGSAAAVIAAWAAAMAGGFLDGG
jgi:membrane associated rhomboid family serine protease